AGGGGRGLGERGRAVGGQPSSGRLYVEGLDLRRPGRTVARGALHPGGVISPAGRGTVRRGSLLAAVSMACASVLGAQTPPLSSPTPAGPDTFPIGVDQVTVDVVVADRHGQPLSGLTAADFTVLEDAHQ